MLLVILLCFIFFVPPAHAFLAVSSFSIILSSLLPYSIALIILFLLTFIAFFRRFKKLSIVLLVIISIGFVFFITKFLSLNKINNQLTLKKDESIVLVKDDSEEDFYFDEKDGLTHDKYWQKFSSNLGYGNKHKIYWDEITGLYMDEISSLYKASTYDLENLDSFDYILGYDYNYDFLQPNGDTDIQGNIFLSLIGSLEDSSVDSIKKSIENLGFKKSDRILFFCPGGYTSTYLAFLFNNTGYQAKAISLEEIVNYDESSVALKQWFDIEKKEKPILIEQLSELNLLKKDQRQSYIFLLLENNNVYSDLCYANEEIINRAKLVETSFHIIPSEVECGQDSEEGIKKFNLYEDYSVFNESEIENLLNYGYEIICTNPWHCFLTKHYLYSQNLDEKVDKIYFVDLGF